MSKRLVLRFDLLEDLNIKNILQLGEYHDIYGFNKYNNNTNQFAKSPNHSFLRVLKMY